MHGDGLDPEFGCGPGNPDGDLSPVGDQNTSEGLLRHGADPIPAPHTAKIPADDHHLTQGGGAGGSASAHP